MILVCGKAAAELRWRRAALGASILLLVAAAATAVEAATTATATVTQITSTPTPTTTTTSSKLSSDISNQEGDKLDSNYSTLSIAASHRPYAGGIDEDSSQLSLANRRGSEPKISERLARSDIASAAIRSTESNSNGNGNGNGNNKQSAASSNQFDDIRTSKASSVSSYDNQTKAANNNNNNKIFTNQFVIEVAGGEQEARKLAEKHGFIYLNHIIADFYHLEHRRLSRRSTSASGLDLSIQDEPQVLRFERQVLKRRVKRDFLELQAPFASGGSQLVSSSSRPLAFPASAARNGVHSGQSRPANQPPGRAQTGPPGSSYRFQPQPQPQPQSQSQPQLDQHHSMWQSGSTPRPAHHQFTRPANQQPQFQGANLIGRFGAIGMGDLLLASDSIASVTASQMTGSQTQTHQPTTTMATPLNTSSSNWGQISGRNINNNNSNSSGNKTAPFNDPSWPLMWYLDGGAKNGFDLNVLAAWKMGYTGKGIVITILDDGLEKDHPDLQANYDPLASFDINSDDADPMPRYDVNDSNRHGTRCAGEVAAVPDNNICSIGIAYNSKVGGVRMLDGDVTDAVEARSLGLNNQHIHIYSASWGPDDNGKTVDGPGEMATKAFIDGVTNGRQGLGSIFVFASGNGGREHDNCNCDGYTNSIWTLSISSATENGLVPWYIESCSSTLATTYSSGSYDERQIATTDLHHSCTSSHTGTSASAPLAAGICALVLESNPKLTWRDMQHIVVRTAKPANLIAKDWRTNALGRNVSHAFGYGLMDAAAMIVMAKQWTTMPEQFSCEIKSPPMDKYIPPKGYIELKLGAKCKNIRFLEHVQSKVTLTASRRGDLHIYLVSPFGTRSTLLAQRPNDNAEQGFKNWPFMTVHSWGEPPNGNWTLEVHNDGKPTNRAHLKDWTLLLHGTKEDPNWRLDPRIPQAPPTGNDINHDRNQSFAPINNRQHGPSSGSSVAVSAGSPSVLPPPIPPLDGQQISKQQEPEVVDLRLGPNANNHANGPNWLNSSNQSQPKQNQWSTPINQHQSQQQQQQPQQQQYHHRVYNNNNNQQQASAGAGQFAHQIPPPTAVLTSYVNTLKNNNLATTTTKVPATTTTTTTTPTSTTFKSAPDTGGHQFALPPPTVLKADFDIVSPAQHTSTSTPSTSTSTDGSSPPTSASASGSSSSSSSTSTSTSATDDTRARPVQVWPNSDTSLAGESSGNYNKTLSERPFEPVEQMHNLPPLKPSVDGSATSMDTNENHSKPTSSTNGHQAKQPTTTTIASTTLNSNEIDANQIDSKLISKDYRSSGDQSIVNFETPASDHPASSHNFDNTNAANIGPQTNSTLDSVHDNPKDGHRTHSNAATRVSSSLVGLVASFASLFVTLSLGAPYSVAL